MTNTAWVPEQAPAGHSTSGRWLIPDLPPVIHTMRALTGHWLCVRLIRPGDRYGVTATSSRLPLVEVRKTTRPAGTCGPAGELVALWDLGEFLEDPEARWLILDAGAGYPCSEAALCGMYATVHEAGAALAVGAE